MTKRLRILVGLLATVGLVMTPGGHAHAALQTTTYFDHPNAVTVLPGGYIFFANSGDGSVEEITSDGALSDIATAAKTHVEHPVALAHTATRVIVVGHRAVAELSVPSAGLIRWIHGRTFGFRSLDAIVVAGSDAWLADSTANSVTEVNLHTGRLIHVTHHKVIHPRALAATPDAIWVVNANDSLTEISKKTGAVITTVKGARFGFADPRGIAYDGQDLWVSDRDSNSVTELTAAGALVQVITNSSNNANYGFNAPTVVTANLGRVFVVSPPGASPMVTRIDSQTGNGDWYECNTNTPDPEFANPTGIAVYGDRIWVASPMNNSLEKLSVQSGALVGRWTN